jgi:hypothetical protein
VQKFSEILFAAQKPSFLKKRGSETEFFEKTRFLSSCAEIFRDFIRGSETEFFEKTRLRNRVFEKTRFLSAEIFRDFIRGSETEFFEKPRILNTRLFLHRYIIHH